MSQIPLGSNQMQFPGQNPQFQQPQMPIHGYPAMNPYENAYFPPHAVNEMPAQPDFSPELLRMYMQQYQSEQMAAMGGMPGHFMPPMPGNPAGQQTSLPPSSGNATISPPVQHQQQQSLPCNPNSAPFTQGFPDNLASVSAQQTSRGTPEVNQHPAFALNNVLAPSTSTNPPSSEKDVEAEKENLSASGNLGTHTAAPKIWRPTSYEESSMMFANQMNPHLFYQQWMQEQLNRKDVCAVCGDSCQGKHFGVNCCEGCKGFFRRSIKDEAYKKYKCYKDNRCMKTIQDSFAKRNMRNCCRECRYKKCIEVGMSRENGRLTEKNAKKEVPRPVEASSPTLEGLTLSFQTIMSVEKRIASETEFSFFVKKFLVTVPAFKKLVPSTESATDKLVEKLLPGLSHIRAAFCLDTLPAFHIYQDKVEKLRSGIRCTILENAGLALLSAIYIFHATNEGRNEIFQLCINELRQHFDATQSQEPGTTERLLTKLGCLE